MSSSGTQSPISNSGDKNTDEEAVYSSAVHNLITVINGGAIGLLQIKENSSASINAADRQATIISFCVFILIYAVLRVTEVKLKRNQATIHHFVGHISHLFGALAALMLISIVSPIFTLIVAPLWLVWFFVVMYFFLVEVICMVKIKHPDPGDANPTYQISQV
ncbi:hypothetical protein ISN45_Aa01g024170 [Arabidopsis thaliana x Arabidopsis arenosa]|uniref:Transmembrane protein n=1 Tax=Arabidopsis thaliana x Arabidopsis arenosa TaxID=1240361 RepID=A0A8T2C0R0_9BRAS|nr:hypothetical protein ISN45_Aa01g024170 [Arabidopsis thaliana x Arabidopsis arenosa]